MDPFIVIILIFGLTLLLRILLNEIKGYINNDFKLQAKDKHIAELKEKTAKLHMVKDQLKAKDKHIAELKEKTAKLHVEKDQLEAKEKHIAELKEKTAKLHTVKDQLEAKDKHIVELKEKTAKLHMEKDQLEAKDKYIAELKEKTAKLHVEKDRLEAKYLKKLKAAEEKKKNLAKYHQNKRNTRKNKTLAGKVAEIVGVGDKWLPHSSSEPKSNKIGKPIGGRGAGRSRPQIIHKVVDMYPKKCSECQFKLDGQKAYFARDSVITEMFHILDEMGHYKYRRLMNVQKNIYRKWCPHCKKWIYPDQGLFASVRFGISFVCYVISERIQSRQPYEMIIERISRDFGGEFNISETAIINWFLKFEVQLKAMYTQLEDMLKEEEFIHIDESGLPMNGENWWLWILCTANIVLYKMSESRGHQSIEDILKGFDGTIIADFFRAYDTFKDNEHQKCLAHLLSAIIEMVVKLDKENGRIEKKFKQHEKAVSIEAESQDPQAPKKRGRKPKLEKLSDEQFETLRQRKEVNTKAIGQGIRLGKFFKMPFDENSIIGWQSTSPEKLSPAEAQEMMMVLVEEIRAEGVENEDLRKVLNRCEKYQDSLFTYLDHEGMPPDNNEAERGLRPFAVQRKISGGFKSPPVMEHYAVYLSLYMTCKANLKDFEELMPRILSKKGVNLRQFLFT
jgi:hypothetical protein